MGLLEERAVHHSLGREDWLSADLSDVMLSPDATPDLRMRLGDVEVYGQCPLQQPPTAVIIFTDGFFPEHADPSLRQCAWAFSVWLERPEGTRYYGHSAFSTVPPQTPYHLGESDDSVTTAEQLALAWALVWALDCGVRFRAPFVFAYDSIVAGAGAFGLARQPSTDAAGRLTPLSATVTALRHCLGTQADITPRHVRGHAGILGNEVADVLAKKAARTQVSFFERCLPVWPAKLARHPLLLWAWKALDPSRELPTLFALPGEAARLQSVVQPIAPPPRDRQPSVRLTGKLDIRISVMTYNVLTLLDRTPAVETQALKA